MNRLERKKRTRKQRKMHIRKRLSGTESIPRLTIYKSNRNLIAQVIDDVEQKTLLSVSTYEKEFRSLGKGLSAGEAMGKEIAGRLKKAKVKSVVFDRNGYKYHGVVKAFADGARSVGIQF